MAGAPDPGGPLGRFGGARGRLRVSRLGRRVVRQRPRPLRRRGPHRRAVMTFRALIFSRTTGFRHTECIEHGTAAIAELAARERFSVNATEDPAAFSDAELAGYDVVIWLSTSGTVLDDDQKAAFERHIRAGHGYVGIHSASGTEYDWPWYGGLVGAYFRDHPGGGVNPQFQTATIDVEDARAPATRGLPARWTREEEWYSFRSNPRSDVHVLLSVDERTDDP